MSQQINLINTALIKQKDFLTSFNIGLLYGTLFAVIGVWYGYLSIQIKTFEESQGLVSKELEQTQQDLAQLMASRKPRSPTNDLQKELANLVDKKNEQNEMILAIQQLNPSEGHALSDYMLGFARQTTEGLWMTGFNIDQEEHSMSLQGRSLRADILPDYMSKLSVEPVFQGQTFGGLTIKDSVPVNPKLNTTTSQTNEKTAPNNGAINLPPATLVKDQVPAYIEFELQGVDKVLNQVLADKSAQ